MLDTTPSGRARTGVASLTTTRRSSRKGPPPTDSIRVRPGAPGVRSERCRPSDGPPAHPRRSRPGHTAGQEGLWAALVGEIKIASDDPGDREEPAPRSRLSQTDDLGGHNVSESEPRCRSSRPDRDRRTCAIATARPLTEVVTCRRAVVVVQRTVRMKVPGGPADGFGVSETLTSPERPMGRAVDGCVPSRTAAASPTATCRRGERDGPPTVHRGTGGTDRNRRTARTSSACIRRR